MLAPLVSIITPCYNSEKWLERYLKCILEQTYGRVELIIVNDGSTDNTEAIALSYKEEFEKRGYALIYHYQENKGLGGAINTALKLMRGEYFTWCDSDNLYTPEYILTKIDFFEKHPQYSVVRCDGYIVKDTDIHTPIRTMATGNPDKFNENLFFNAVEIKNFHFGCAMLRTADFDKINPQRDIYESREGQNWQLMLPMLYHYKAGYIDKPMFIFVLRSDSISNVSMSKGLQAQLDQNEEYINILTRTIRGMNIPEQQQCLAMIDRQYTRKKLHLAHKYKDAALTVRAFLHLKEIDHVTAKEKMYYFCAKYKAVAALYNLLHRN